MPSTNTWNLTRIEACIKGDRSAQNELYEHFKVPMFRVCLRYARSQAEAEDMLQEGFFRVFTSLAQYSGKGNFAGWVRRIMVNASISYLRRKELRYDSWDKSPVWAEQQGGGIPAHTALESEDIISMIQRLPAGYRSVFNLYAIEGYSHKEIGKMLEISESTSRSQYARARSTLKNLMEKLFIL